MVYQIILSALGGLLLSGGSNNNGDNPTGLNLRSIIWILIALIGIFILLRIFLSISDLTIIEAIGADEWFVTRFIQTGVEGIQDGLQGWVAVGSAIAGAGASLFKRN